MSGLDEIRASMTEANRPTRCGSKKCDVRAALAKHDEEEMPFLRAENERLREENKMMKAAIALSVQTDGDRTSASITLVNAAFGALEESAVMRRERDAAVADIEHVCSTCAYNGIPDERCAQCSGSSDNWRHDTDNWQWRGPQEATGDE